MIKYAHAHRLDNMEVRRAVRWLREQNDNGATFKEDGLYHAYITPFQEGDLLSDPNITSVYQIASPRGENNPLLKGSVPSVYGMAFYRVRSTPSVLPGDYLLITGSDFGSGFHTAIFRASHEIAPDAIEIDWSHKI